ncbi:hypothetical protein ACPA9J_07440 [Pseudomonas aeruginosa]
MSAVPRRPGRDPAADPHSDLSRPDRLAHPPGQRRQQGSPGLGADPRRSPPPALRPAPGLGRHTDPARQRPGGEDQPELRACSACSMPAASRSSPARS